MTCFLPGQLSSIADKPEKNALLLQIFYTDLFANSCEFGFARCIEHVLCFVQCCVSPSQLHIFSERYGVFEIFIINPFWPTY